MRLAIFRHGAINNHQSDNDPSLTEEGARTFGQRVLEMEELGHCVTVIISSQYRRAIDSAKLAASVFPEAEVFASPALNPGFDPDRCHDLLEVVGHRGANAVMLIGHEPDVSSVALELCGVDDGSRNGWYLPTGCGVVLEHKRQFEGAHFVSIHTIGRIRPIPSGSTSKAASQ